MYYIGSVTMEMENAEDLFFICVVSCNIGRSALPDMHTGRPTVAYI